MAIRITRNDAGNCITFVGSTQPVYFNACLSGQVNTDDSNAINIVNDIETGDGSDKYVFYAIPYTEFQTAEGVNFASAAECVTYIDENCNVTGADFLNQTAGDSTTLLLNTNPSVYADGKAGETDPTNVSQGWYFKNSANTSEKANWYYIYNGNSQLEMTLESLTSGYALIDVRAGGSPFFTIYTQAQGDGQDSAIWFRSRQTYIAPDLTSYIGETILLWWGDDPGVFDNVTQVEASLEAFSSIGPQAADEDLLFGAFSTSTNYPEGTYEFVVSNLGFVNDGNRIEFLLESASATHVTTSQGASVNLDFQRDATNTTVLVDNGDAFPVNAIQANLESDGTISIVEHGAQGSEIYTQVYSSNVTIAGATITGTAQSVVNQLNALFSVTPLGVGGTVPLPTFPTSTGVPVTANTYGLIDPVGDADYAPQYSHYGRYWSDETIDQIGEHYTVKWTGHGRIILGLYSTADGDITELETSGNVNDHAGIKWSHALYDYGSYMGPWTTYGSNSGLIYGPGWLGSDQSKLFRYKTDLQADLVANTPILCKVGINEQGYACVWYYDEGVTNTYILLARSSYQLPEDDYGLVVKLYGQSGGMSLWEDPEVHLLDPVAPSLNYRYIESPDGTFHYPLFATQEESDWHDDNVAGGSGDSTSNVFVDEQTQSTWWMPDTDGVSNGTSAPSNAGSITYTEIPTQADSLFGPTTYGTQTMSVDENTSLNIQIDPVGSFNWTTAVTGLPAGMNFNLGSIAGTAPEVAGDNVTNPSDEYVITVTRTNAYSSSTGTLTLTVNNLTLPATIISGFTHEATSTALIDSDTLDVESVVEWDDQLEDGSRFIITKQFVETYILPRMQNPGDQIICGVLESGFDVSTVETSDFDCYISWYYNGTSAHYSRLQDNISSSSNTQIVNSLTDAFYDYAIEISGTTAYLIACSVANINTEPSPSTGMGSFTRLKNVPGYGSSTANIVFATIGCTMDISTTGLSEIDTPLPSSWFNVTESANVMSFNGSTTFPTLNAGYTYRFLLEDASISDALRFTTDLSAEYTTGVTHVGTPGTAGAYVEIAVATDVPPLYWYHAGSQAGQGISNGSLITMNGSTYSAGITGATHVTGTTALSGSDLADGSFIELDETLAQGERMVIDGQWIYDNIIPTFSATNDQVWIGVPSSSFTDGLDYNEYRVGVTLYQISTGDILARAFRSNGSSSYTVSSVAVDLKSLTESQIVSRLGIAFEFDSNQDVHAMYQDTGSFASDNATTTAVDDWGSSLLKSENIGTNTAQSIYIGVQNTTMAEPDVTTDITTVSAPAASSAALTTNWTKALDFDGSSERCQMIVSSSSVGALEMGGVGNTAVAGSAGNTSTDSNARPWATAIVFNSDNASSNQHIWNQGEGAGSSDDNIYLRVDSSRDMYFGWGRSGALNECYLGRLSSTAGTWYGVYIASTGARYSGGHTAAEIASAFDIRIVGLSSGVAGLNRSTALNWTSGSFGSRMDRQFEGEFTVGGRGSNRSFQGKVASMVLTTLTRNAAMPSDAEISMMVRDPMQWITDYKVAKAYRIPSSASNSSTTWVLNQSPSRWATQVWLMGDGTSDAFAQIRNQAGPGDQNYSALNMISMVSNDIVTVNINGLT